MGRCSLIPVLFVALAVSVRAELQLNPRPDEYELDGTKLKQLAFSDGDKKVTYAPPRGWDCSGSGSQLTLHPPKRAQAEAIVTKIGLPKPGTLDDQSQKKLVEEALASLPKGSTDIQLVSQEKNPLQIDRKETFLAVVSYSFYGESYGRSILFLNRGNEQIRFQLTSRQSDFKDLHKAFLGSQYSWQGL
jgi:hypothetical protein